MQRLLLIAFASFYLSACSLGGGSLPTDHFYRLSPVQLQPVESVQFQQVVVSPVKVSGLLHDRAILYSEDTSLLELKPYHYHYWADSPAYLLHEALYQGLTSSQLAQHVSRNMIASRADVVISSRLLRFERHIAKTANTVIVELEVEVKYADTSRPAWNKVYRLERQQQGPIYSAIEAFSHATQDIVQQLVDDLLDKK